MFENSHYQSTLRDRAFSRRLHRSFVAILLLLPMVVHAKVYYVSNNGSDAGDGQSPETAWRTLGRVNAGHLKAGDMVRFNRGDTWRGQLVPYNGDEPGHVTYGAYGDGAKPLLLGSVSADEPNDWRKEKGDIWSSTSTSLTCDVGNIIFNKGQSVGVKKWSLDDLKKQRDYWYDEKTKQVKLYCSGNPASTYRSIELALNRHIIPVAGKRYITFEDLALRYGAAHGIGCSNTHDITVRRCDVSYIGGGHQFTRADGHPVRFGNGIEFWNNSHDNLVEKCRLWEVYDAALTNQNNAPNVKQYNITYRENVIWNCEYSFEYWNRPENSLTYNIHFENNTCVDAGYGWGHDQRPDPSGRHLCFYSSPAAAHDIYIRNNIFHQATGNAFYAPTWPANAINQLNMDYNCWYQSSGAMILLQSRSFAMNQFASYQADLNKEAHSMARDALIADIAKCNFHLSGRSPCIDAGQNLGFETDTEETAIPQGSGPDIGAYEYRGNPR